MVAGQVITQERERIDSIRLGKDQTLLGAWRCSTNPFKICLGQPGPKPEKREQWTRINARAGTMPEAMNWFIVAVTAPRAKG